MIERVNPPNGDMALSARRTVWRRLAGKMVPNLGRLAAVVALSEAGERVPIFASRGTFKLTLNGRTFRLGHLGDAEMIAAGWLLRGEGFSEGGCE